MLAQQLINGLSVGGIYALLSTGYALIYSLLGFSNWAHGEVAMLGAYIAVMSVITAKLPFVASLALGRRARLRRPCRPEDRGNGRSKLVQGHPVVAYCRSSRTNLIGPGN